MLVALLALGITVLRLAAGLVVFCVALPIWFVHMVTEEYCHHALRYGLRQKSAAELEEERLDREWHEAYYR